VRGRYSHIAAVMEGRVLLVAGGYSGVARGDLLAYKVPLFVSSDPGDRVKTLDYTFSSVWFSVSVCLHALPFKKFEVGKIFKMFLKESLRFIYLF